MRWATGLGVIGLALLGFGYWGLESNLGRETFDEMAGMIPWAAKVFGATLVAVALCWGALGRRRRLRPGTVQR